MGGTMSEAAAAVEAGEVSLREIEPGDIGECARICFEAFGRLADHHGFPRDFPSCEFTQVMMQSFASSASTWGGVAQLDGRIVGSNFLHEGEPIGGVGPISVDPDHQDGGVGRRLMDAVIERGTHSRGTRLLQDGFNIGSLSLYASLGFEVREPAVVMSGRPASGPVAG